MKLFAEAVFVAVPVVRVPAHASVIVFPETVFPLASLPPNVVLKWMPDCAEATIGLLVILLPVEKM